MKFHISYLLLFISYFISSCTEDYQLPNPGSQSIIVISGLITNEAGPYYVTVEENLPEFSTGKVVVQGINDARITISDSEGNVDELRSFYSVPIERELEESIRYPSYRDYYQIPDGEGGYVKFYLYEGGDDTRVGKYFTTSTKGKPGLTYTIKVEYAGREYVATDYMCYGTVIDSLSLEPIGRYIYDKPDGSDGFLVPCLYFAEPKNEVNFYMFTYFGFTTPKKTFVYTEPVKNFCLSTIVGRGAYWPVSVVSDRFMPPYVNKYKMSDGDHNEKWESGTDTGFYQDEQGWEYGGVVDMYCITEPIYRFYYALADQYYDDGGAFSPSPASPPTNFSGGAQGCFSAASVSQYILDLRK